MRTKIAVEKIATYSGHRDCIYSLEGGNPTSHFFTSGSDALVVRWDLNQPDQGELVAQVRNTVYALCFLEAQNQLVVGQNFDGIHLIDLAEKKEIKSLQLTESAIFDIKHIGNTLLIACGDGALILVDQPSFTIVNRIQLSDASARCIAISPSKEEIAIGYSDHKIRILSTADWQVKHTLDKHTNSIFSLAYHPTLPFLLSGSRDAHLRIWDTANGYIEHKDIVAHMYTINHISFREDGNYFATCSKDKSIKVWDASQFQLLKVIDKARHAGHGTSVNKLKWVSDNQLISASDDRSISVWNLSFNEL